MRSETKKDTAARHDGSLVVHAGLLLPPTAAPQFGHDNNVLNLHKVGGHAGNISGRMGGVVGRGILVIILCAVAVGGRLVVVYK